MHPTSLSSYIDGTTVGLSFVPQTALWTDMPNGSWKQISTQWNQQVGGVNYSIRSITSSPASCASNSFFSRPVACSWSVAMVLSVQDKRRKILHEKIQTSLQSINAYISRQLRHSPFVEYERVGTALLKYGVTVSLRKLRTRAAMVRFYYASTKLQANLLTPMKEHVRTTRQVRTVMWSTAAPSTSWRSFIELQLCVHDGKPVTAL